MELMLHTDLQGNYRQVLGHFDQELFEALAPRFPKLHLLRFDGSKPGDVVEVELQAGPLKQRWSSLITDRGTTATEAWFTDTGQQLPPPLRYWHHRHLVTRLSASTCRITDHISFRTGSTLLDRLLYPVLKWQFGKRRSVYRRWFGSPILQI